VVTTANGVKIIGYTDLPGRLPTQSSQLYGTNLVNLLKLLCKEKDGNVVIDFDDVVIAALPWFAKVKSPGPRHHSGICSAAGGSEKG
jgi:NAD/NADP transhydrogenase alpha subunit